ncbi:hypothetical protein ACSMXN_07995 [Jatrophihabitans sp. DSM 45814]
MGAVVPLVGAVVPLVGADMSSMRPAAKLPDTLRAAVAAEFLRARRPPFEIPIVVASNGLLVVLFWFSRFHSIMFTLHGGLAFPIALGSWMYSDVPATNVLGADARRVLAALDDMPTLQRMLAAKAALLWLMIAPGCVALAVIIGAVYARPMSALWTVIVIAIVPLGALSVSDWVGIIWPYPPLSLRTRWRHRREIRTQLRWLLLIFAPYAVVPAVFVAVALPALGWWRHETGGEVSRIPDALFGQLTVISAVTSLVVFFAGRSASRWLLGRRRSQLRAFLSQASED